MIAEHAASIMIAVVTMFKILSSFYSMNLLQIAKYLVPLSQRQIDDFHASISSHMLNNSRVYPSFITLKYKTTQHSIAIDRVNAEHVTS